MFYNLKDKDEIQTEAFNKDNSNLSSLMSQWK
jgi:hypothetical protein